MSDDRTLDTKLLLRLLRENANLDEFLARGGIADGLVAGGDGGQAAHIARALHADGIVQRFGPVHAARRPGREIDERGAVLLPDRAAPTSALPLPRERSGTSCLRVRGWSGRQTRKPCRP